MTRPTTVRNALAGAACAALLGMALSAPASADGPRTETFEAVFEIRPGESAADTLRRFRRIADRSCHADRNWSASPARRHARDCAADLLEEAVARTRRTKLIALHNARADSAHQIPAVPTGARAGTTVRTPRTGVLSATEGPER